MIERFEIVGSASPRPKADRIIFCNGTGGHLFCDQTDLELSHWRPNRTPTEYRAGTSTEICYRFLDDSRPGSWTVAVNNHLDVDGILSVYSLVESEHALAHRRTIIDAAEMGDFWGWGEPPAQRVFQGITHLMDQQRQLGVETKAIYAEAIRRIPALIAGTDPLLPEFDESLASLHQGVQLIEGGQIIRSTIGNRLAHYVVPLSVAGRDDARVSYVPRFNEAISTKARLWPQVRSRWDADRVCLVSYERDHGWYHDLWFPGYLWADADRWQVPGMNYHDGMESYEIDNPALVAAVEGMQRIETAPGRWGLGGTPLPFGDDLQRLFPLVGRFLDDQGQPTVSQLSPNQVARAFAGVFE